MDYEVEGVRPRGIWKKTWRKIVEKGCQTRQPIKKDSVDHG